MQVELYGGGNSLINNPRAGTGSTSFTYRNALFTIKLHGGTFDFNQPFPENVFLFVDRTSKVS